MELADLNVEDLRLFIAVVDSHSITVAAERLNTTSSTISRRLKKIEGCLSVRLLDRTTRSQQITSAGQVFYEHCQTVLGQLEVVTAQITDQRDSLEGCISVYAPSELFRYWLKELVIGFAQRYPKLRVEFISGAGKPHLLNDNIDVMLHIDEPADSSFVARKITVSKTNYYASPSYLERCGKPTTPNEMRRHDCIIELNHERVPRPWQFIEGDTITTLQVNARYSSDSISFCMALAEEGQGITMLPDFVVKESVAKGKLVKLFTEHCAIPHNIYAVYASRHFVPAKISTFISYLADNLPGEF